MTVRVGHAGNLAMRHLAVNIAARVQNLADAEEIYVSGAPERVSPFQRGHLSQEECVKKAPRKCGAFLYLRRPERGPEANTDPLRKCMEARVFPKALPPLGKGAAGPVVLHVGVGFTDEPTDGATYEPTDGATDDPYPESPGLCASANVLESAEAVASTIVLSFMRCPSCRLDKRQSYRLFDRSINSSSARLKPPGCSHLAEPRCFSNRLRLPSEVRKEGAASHSSGVSNKLDRNMRNPRS